MIVDPGGRTIEAPPEHVVVHEIGHILFFDQKRPNDGLPAENEVIRRYENPVARLIGTHIVRKLHQIPK